MIRTSLYPACNVLLLFRQGIGLVRSTDEQILNAQKSFFENVKSLSSVMQEMGNPFEEESEDLLVLDTRPIPCQNGSNTLQAGQREVPIIQGRAGE